MWTITGNLGAESREGVDASGWVWEIARGDEARRVLVEVSIQAVLTTDDALPDDTANAIRTEGESEVVKILDVDDPPRLISCDTSGCQHGGAEESLD